MNPSIMLAGVSAACAVGALGTARDRAVTGVSLCPDVRPTMRTPFSLPAPVGKWLEGRKTSHRATEQLPDCVSTLADALRAGLSLQDAFDFAAREASEPLASQLKRIVDDVEDGLPIESALRRWVDERPDDRSVGLLVAVLSLNRRTGGDIPSILDGVRRTVGDRTRAVREVASLTAQARLSASVIVLLPVGFLGFVALTSPRDLATSVGSLIGILAFVVGLTLDLLAFLWMRSLLKVVV